MITKTRIMMMTLEKMAAYSKLCEGHEESFSNAEQNLGDELYSIIKKARNERKISSFANDADLLILAQCFIYRKMRYEGGFMYLVTADNGLHDTANEVVSKPKTIFSDLKDTDRYPGFEPIKPERFLAVFKNATTK
ncbi:MAG: hypothetical protein GX638_08250 [Crenarchaeota archaeon]|nr:hypothetical protein [Thermoproteota archaeon]